MPWRRLGEPFRMLGTYLGSPLGAGAYSPLQEGSAHFGYDFSAGVPDAAIATWLDLSGNNRTLTFDATKQPLFKANILNGLGGALFDATNDAGYTSAFAWGANKATIYILFSAMPAGADRCLIEFGNATSQNGSWLLYRSAVTNNQLVTLLRNGGTFANALTVSNKHTAAYLMVGVFDETAVNKCTIYINGTLDVFSRNNGAVGTANFDTKVLNLGGRANGTSMPSSCYIHETWGFADAHGTDAMARMVNYFLGKWGGPPFSFGVGDYADNAYAVTANRSDGGTFVQGSPASRVVVSTDADYMFMDTYNDLGALSGFGDVGVRVNGVDVDAFENQASAAAIYSVALGVKGVIKDVELLNGIQSMVTGTRKGEWITGARFNGSATVVSGSEPTTPRILVYGDSIAGGQAAANPSLQGWVQLLRNAYAATGSVILEGWGNRKLKDDAETAGARTAFAAHIASVAPTIIWLAIGCNDQGSWTAAAFGAAYADLLDKINAVLPGATIYAQTPIQKTVEGDMADYRTEIATAQSTRGAFCVLVDGTDIAFPQPADLAADGIHPANATAQDKYGDAVIAVLGI